MGTLAHYRGLIYWYQ